MLLLMMVMVMMSMLQARGREMYLAKLVRYFSDFTDDLAAL